MKIAWWLLAASASGVFWAWFFGWVSWTQTETAMSLVVVQGLVLLALLAWRWLRQHVAIHIDY